jgi:hypothetical protein
VSNIIHLSFKCGYLFCYVIYSVTFFGSKWIISWEITISGKAKCPTIVLAHILCKYSCLGGGRCSVVGSTTFSEFDGPGFEPPSGIDIFNTLPDRLWCSLNLLCNGYWVSFQGVKAAELWLLAATTIQRIWAFMVRYRANFTNSWMRYRLKIEFFLIMVQLEHSRLGECVI